MIKILKNDLEEIFEYISNYILLYNVSENVIEKDLWNCYFLDYLFNRSKYKDYFIFKGGTSLSKCYNIIDRYSEDLDIVLDSHIFGINLEEKMDSLTSRNQREKFIESINEQAMNFIENELMPTMKKECEEEVGKELSFNLVRKDLAFYISFPHHANYDYITPSVKVEMSSLSAIIPTEKRTIEPYINKVLTDEFKAFFDVKCMRPERTFYEKSLILHQEANRINGDIPKRYSRHYYDICKIYNSSYWESTKNNIKLLDDVRKFTITFYNRSWSKFEEARPGTFKLVPNDKYVGELENDYNLMSLMIFSNPMEFKELIKTIQKIEKEINSL